MADRPGRYPEARFKHTLDGVELVPAACRGKLLGLAASPRRVVVACGKPGTETGTVGIFGPKLAVTTTQTTAYKDPLFGPELADGAHLCLGHAAWCVELATGKLTQLPPWTTASRAGRCTGRPA